MTTTATAQQAPHVVDIEPRPAMPLATAPEPVAPPAARTMTPGDLLVIAQQKTPDDIDRLERLLLMQERYQTTERARLEEDRQREAKLAFRRAFVAFRSKNIIVPKSRYVDRGKAGSFNQAEFDVASRMLTPSLAECGLSVRHDQRFGERTIPAADDPNQLVPWVWVTCYLEHVDGHSETMELDGPAHDSSANTLVQNQQSTASYLKRQSLLAITGTATGGEDDESGLRGKSAEGSPAEDEREKLLQAGEDAAAWGMESLNKWWAALTAKQRNVVGAAYKSMRDAAQRADRSSGGSAP